MSVDDIRAMRIENLRAEHKALHAYCKWQRGPHDVYQRLCLDPCHRVKKVQGAA